LITKPEQKKANTYLPTKINLNVTQYQSSARFS